MFNSGSNFGENYSDAISFVEGNAISMEPEKVINTIADWLLGTELFLEIREAPRS